VGGRGDPRPCYARLAQAYSEPHRYYHTFRHVTECLDVFDSARHLADQPDAVEIAIWFHDAVYDTRSSDNEERSAILARQCLLEAGVGNGFVDTVSQLIVATKSHDATTEETPR
jgi:predicted metal-dependent HD superfamily phosphohydrolase